jgi:uncharacterized protein YjbI with pentapeptide repeats
LNFSAFYSTPTAKPKTVSGNSKSASKFKENQNQMPQTFFNPEIYNEGKKCTLCDGTGWLLKREGLTKVICRYCYGIGKRDRSIENKQCYNIDFKSAILTRDAFFESSFLKCNFSGSCLRETKFTNCNSKESVYVDTNLISAELSNCAFSECHFPASVFADTKFSFGSYNNTDFWHACFYGSTISGTHFNDSAFQAVTMKDCRVQNVEFRNCFLKNSIFENNYFSRCVFKNCNLNQSRFKNNEFEQCTFEECTFSLSNILYSNPSIDFLKHLIIQNHNLAVFGEYSLFSYEVDANAEEVACIKYSLDTANKLIHSTYKVLKDKSFYCLWTNYGLRNENLSENKKIEVLEFWIKTLYKNKYKFNDIVEIVEIVRAKSVAEYTNLNRIQDLHLPPLSEHIANLIDKLIGYYDSKGGDY